MPFLYLVKILGSAWSTWRQSCGRPENQMSQLSLNNTKAWELFNFWLWWPWTKQQNYGFHFCMLGQVSHWMISYCVEEKVEWSPVFFPLHQAASLWWSPLKYQFQLHTLLLKVMKGLQFLFFFTHYLNLALLVMKLVSLSGHVNV